MKKGIVNLLISNNGGVTINQHTKANFEFSIRPIFFVSYARCEAVKDY